MMKIVDVEPIVVHVNQHGDWVFLLVHADTGLVGLGEASHSGNDALLLATVEIMKEQLAGTSPLQIGVLWHRLARLDGGRIAHTALSGIEQALWDILGQHLGMPIHAFFGGAFRDRLRLYANINRMGQLLVAPHNPSGPVATVASAHACSTMHNFLILEYAWGEVDWRADLLTPPEPIAEGYLRVSNAPGLGYRLNPEVLQAHRRPTPGMSDFSRVRPG